MMMTTQLRFVKKISAQYSGCWEWTASCNQKGYGNFYYCRCVGKAHRFAWEQAHGPVPDGMVLDHICKNRKCVNPKHLRTVTNRDNVLHNSESVIARNAKKTHCKHGHEFTTENTIVRSSGGRDCLICKRERDKKRWNAKFGSWGLTPDSR